MQRPSLAGGRSQSSPMHDPSSSMHDRSDRVLKSAGLRIRANVDLEGDHYSKHSLFLTLAIPRRRRLYRQAGGDGPNERCTSFRITPRSRGKLRNVTFRPPYDRRCRWQTRDRPGRREASPHPSRRRTDADSRFAVREVEVGRSPTLSPPGGYRPPQSSRDGQATRQPSPSDDRVSQASTRPMLSQAGTRPMLCTGGHPTNAEAVQGLPGSLAGAIGPAVAQRHGAGPGIVRPRAPLEGPDDKCPGRLSVPGEDAGRPPEGPDDRCPGRLSVPGEDAGAPTRGPDDKRLSPSASAGRRGAGPSRRVP